MKRLIDTAGTILTISMPIINHQRPYSLKCLGQLNRNIMDLT